MHEARHLVRYGGVRRMRTLKQQVETDANRRGVSRRNAAQAKIRRRRMETKP